MISCSLNGTSGGNQKLGFLKKPDLAFLSFAAVPEHSSGWRGGCTSDSACHPSAILETWASQNGAPGKAPVTLAKGRCESQPASPRSCQVKRFLPETWENLCGEHTVGSREPALAYRQITGRDEVRRGDGRGKGGNEGEGAGRKTFITAEARLGQGWKPQKGVRWRAGPKLLQKQSHVLLATGRCLFKSN